MLDQGGLARAVLAEDRHGLAGLDGQRDAAHGLDAGGKAVHDVVDDDADRSPVADGVQGSVPLKGVVVSADAPGRVVAVSGRAEASTRDLLAPRLKSRRDGRFVERPGRIDAGHGGQPDQCRGGQAHACLAWARACLGHRG